MSGEITVSPGQTFADGELVTYAKLNLLGQPLARVDEGAIGERELDEAAVRTLAPPLNRNLIINGNFDVWERGGWSGALFQFGLPDEMGRLTSTAQFTADRWLSKNVTSAVDRRAISRQPFASGQLQVPNEPAYYLSYQQLITDAGSSLGQTIEDVRTMAGKRVTLTWWMKSADFSGAVTARLEQWYGGSPGPTGVLISAASGGTATLVSGAAWVKYTAIFDVPALDGTSISIDNCLVLRFLLPTGTWTIDFSQVQLEEGDGATSFERRSYFDELIRCERYFEFHGGFFASDISTAQPCFYFATRKRGTPTLAFVTAPGTGGEVQPLTMPIGYYQSVQNDSVDEFTLTADAEISR